MLHYPEVMRKAQEELDTAVGVERMPEYDDESALSYISAVMCETLRWRPVAVLGGTPHAVTEDDEYHGMFVHHLVRGLALILDAFRYIPKGSTVFANL